jgi:SAM-dependent MidA family methyltransferase
MLIRQYVGKRLADYYAQSSNKVVGSTSLDNIQFSNLCGEWHWKRVYKKLFEQQEGQWLTPVELFRPHFSNILGNFIVKSCVGHDNADINIVELGGGRGTNAQLVLSHLQATYPDFYDRITSYTIVDSSPTLHELQKKSLVDGEHGNLVDFVLQDLTEIAEEK